MTKQKNPQKRVDQLVKTAESRGLSEDETFIALLEDFYYKKRLLERLRAKIDSMELESSREYIKGKPNINPNAFISQYNSTSNSLCNTVGALSKLLKISDSKEETVSDPLAEALGGTL